MPTVGRVDLHAHGNVDGQPNNSWLNQFPHRPIAWANGNAGVTASSNSPTASPRDLATNTPANVPAAIPPGMPRPPSHTSNMRIR